MATWSKECLLGFTEEFRGYIVFGRSKAKNITTVENCDCDMQSAGLSARVWGKEVRGETVSFACQADLKAKLYVYGGPKTLHTLLLIV
jgi:hypothetical protein